MLVGEVEDLRKMMESLKRMVTGQGLEEKRGETGASLEEAEEKEKEKSVGEKTRENSSTESSDDSDTRLQEEPGESSWK